MAVSLFQKLKLAFRGWNRRRDEKQEEFLRRNVAWGASQAPPPVKPESRTGGAPVVQKGPPLPTIDLEGLQAAYLDGSGMIAYYLDAENGEVVESRDGSSFDVARFKRVPTRASSDDDDRRAFIASLDPSPVRDALMKSMSSNSFRSVLANDRAVERSWYNFKNSRATSAIEEWLVKQGLR